MELNIVAQCFVPQIWPHNADPTKHVQEWGNGTFADARTTGFVPCSALLGCLAKDGVRCREPYTGQPVLPFIGTIDETIAKERKGRIIRMRDDSRVHGSC